MATELWVWKECARVGAIAPEATVARDGGVGGAKKKEKDSGGDAIQAPGIPENATGSCGVDVLERVCCQGESWRGGKSRDKRKLGRKRSSEKAWLFPVQRM